MIQHQIELPVTSLVKGQFIDVSEMGLVIANQSSDANHSAKVGESGETLDLSTLQYVRIVDTNEGHNTIALQPVIIPQNWTGSTESLNAPQIQASKLDTRHKE